MTTTMLETVDVDFESIKSQIWDLLALAKTPEEFLEKLNEKFSEVDLKKVCVLPFEDDLRKVVIFRQRFTNDERMLIEVDGANPDLKVTQIWISTPDGVFHRHGLKIMSEDRKIIQRFWELCQEYLFEGSSFNVNTPRGFFCPFLQSNDWNFKYIECLALLNVDVQEKLLEVALKIAEELELELGIDNY